MLCRFSSSDGTSKIVVVFHLVPFGFKPRKARLERLLKSKTWSWDMSLVEASLFSCRHIKNTLKVQFTRKIPVFWQFVILWKICRDLWWEEMKEEFSVLSVDIEDTEVERSQLWCPLAVPVLMISRLKFPSPAKTTWWLQWGKNKLCLILGAWSIFCKDLG